MSESGTRHGFLATDADGWSRAIHYDACFTAEERALVEQTVAALPKVPHEIVVRADGALPFPGWAVETLGGKVEAHITAWGWNPARCDTASFAAIRRAARQLPAKPLRIEVSSPGALGSSAPAQALAESLSAVSSLPEELRGVVWRHAVDLYAYFGKPVEQLSREQIALWLGLRAEWQRLSEADAALLDGHGRPWGRTPKPRVQDPQNWIAEFNADGDVVGYIRVRRDRAAEADAARAGPVSLDDAAERLSKLGSRHPDGGRAFAAKIRAAAEAATREGDLQAGRDAAEVIAAMAAPPLSPRALRDTLRPILTRNSPASVLTTILCALEECVCVFSDEGDEEARAEALNDATAVRTALAALSRTAWKPFHDARHEASAEHKRTP